MPVNVRVVYAPTMGLREVPMPPINQLLAVDGLNTYYGHSHILRDVSLDLPARCALGLLGRNGMGKSTLLKSLMGLVKPKSGTVNVMGCDMTGRAPYEIARMGIAYVPEGRGIFANLSVRENLEMAARAGADGRREWTMDRVLETFPRLGERIAMGGQQLSGGEQQMLAIGRALMTNPVLMILDEATEGLAPRIVAEIWRVIAAIRAGGISTIVVDRNFKTVLAHTDRAIVLEKGRVALAGDSAELAKDHGKLASLLGV
jgi:branched-chain amino acid transport system ATP-binding protein